MFFGCFSMRSLTFGQRLGIENLNPDDINESLTFENKIQCEFQAKKNRTRENFALQEDRTIGGPPVQTMIDFTHD